MHRVVEKSLMQATLLYRVDYARSAQELVEGDRQITDTSAGGVIDGVGDGGQMPICIRAQANALDGRRAIAG
jgi:hypothetical protein